MAPGSTPHRHLLAALTALTLFWGVFALLSGAAEQGGGLAGLLRNAPNALPWVAVLALVALARRRPLAGGLALAALGALSIPLLGTWRYLLTFALVSLPYIALGLALAAQAWHRRAR